MVLYLQGMIAWSLEILREVDCLILKYYSLQVSMTAVIVEHGGIISQADRELFAENQMELSPTDRQRSFIQKFYLYLNLTKPSERLYLTWFRVNQEGKESRKSYLVGTIQKMFPEFVPVRIEEQTGMEQIVTPKSSCHMDGTVSVV